MKSETRKIIIVLVVFAAAVAAGYFLTAHNEKKAEFVVENPMNAPTADRVVAGVSGAVKAPGLYSILKGTSLHDVLHIAGGVTENADLSGFDFDTYVCEDCTIFVPEQSALPEKSSAKLPIDINNADAEELSTLPGIGDKLALQIINYRNLHGKFKRTDELMEIKGIGKNKYEAIKDMITVGGN